MSRRHPGVLLGAWLAVALAAVPVSGAEIPVVRLVEVGDRGVVFADVVIRATLEVTTARAFHGTLAATYRWSEDPAWRLGVSWGDQSRLPLDLGPGRTTVEVELPSPSRAMSGRGPQPLLELVWGLEDTGGARLASGRQPARLEPAPALRILRLATEPGEGFRRPPGDAWTVPAGYEPYALVLVSREDVRGLRDDQRRALLDAVALGLTLVVTSAGGTGAFDPLGPPWDEALGNERVVWRGDAGDEIRETPLLWGLVRRTTLVPAVPPEGADDAALLRWMLATAPPGRPGVAGVFVPEESRPLALLRTLQPERARAARLGAGSAYAAVTLVLVLLFLGTRGSGRPPRLPIAAAVAACVASPPLLYVALANVRAGNQDWRFRVTVHDGRSPLACVGLYESRGGGGGSGPVSLPWGSPRRGLMAAGSLRSPQLTVSRAGDGIVRITASDRGLAPDSITHVFTRSLAAPDPLWEAAVSWRAGRLTGTLTARRAVKDAWILGLHSADGAHVGAVPAGGRIDVSTLSPARGRAELEKDLGALRRAWMGYFGAWIPEVPGPYWAAPGFTPSFVVSEEEAADDGTAAYDYQSLRPPGAPDGAPSQLPAVRRGSEVHVALPRALGLPDDLDLLVSGVADQSSSRPARVVEAPDGLRRAILEGRFRALEPWSRLRPDLPKGTGYVAVRTKGGT